MPARIPLEEIPATIRAVPDSSKDLTEDGPDSGRSIVVCLDGTGDTFDEDNSNLVKVFQALRKDDPRQLCYYQSGVGTYTSASKGSLKSGLSAALDMAVGSSVGVHIREAYSFLMQNYEDRDKISIFGFSRGAYTARALAGMLHKVGLLPAHNQAQIAFAYKWYKDDTKYGWEMSADFKRTFCIDVDVHFMGCWDTVASVGVIPRILPFAKTNNTSVRYFRHALALDEHRAKFKANHWLQRHPQTEAQKKLARERQRMETEHAKRSAGAGRGVHVDQEGHVASYGAFGSLNLGHINRRAEETLDGTASPVSDNTSARRNRDISLRTSLASIGRRTSRVGQNLAASDRKGDGQTPEAGSQISGRASLRKSLADGKTTDDSILDEKSLPLECQGEADISESQYDKGTSKNKVRKSQKQINLMQEFNAKDEREWGRSTHETDVLEVWFSGCHADVGSGAVPNKTRHMISRIPLRWMIRQSFLCNTGILYRSDVLAEHGLDVDTLYPKVLERKTGGIGPRPSDMDRYAQGKLPSLDCRRALVRRSTSQEAGSMSSAASASIASPDASGTGIRNDAANGNSDSHLGLEEMNSFAQKLGPALSTAAKDADRPSQSSLGNSSTARPSTAGTITKDDQPRAELDILSEVHEDFFDCQASINDELVNSKGWWILEMIPVKYRVKEKDGTWRKKVGMNMGRYRSVRDSRPKMHWTVLQRQQLLGYQIKCDTNDDVIWEVVM